MHGMGVFSALVDVIHRGEERARYSALVGKNSILTKKRVYPYLLITCPNGDRETQI